MEVRIDTSEDKRLRELLETASRLQGRALARLAQALHRAGLEIVGAAVKGRFSGKGPFPISDHKLGVRSGRLRRAIRVTKPQVNLRTGEIAMQFGANVVYFSIHEFGFQGQVGVRQHTRRLAGPQKFRRGKLTKAYQTRLKQRITRRNLAGATPGNAGGTTVRAHRRKVDMKARAPLGTQLKDRTTTAAFLRALRNALEPLLRGK